MTRMVSIVAAAVAAAAVPAAAAAQALSCAVPGEIPAVRPDLPSPSQPRRVLPIGSYTLAISWSPQFCRGAAGQRPSSAFQCGGENRFGFTLHGLWPDGRGKTWPQYCRDTPLLPEAVIRANLCTTPSAQLLQHEWAKHGTCMAGYTPQRYFATAGRLYRRLRFPDMAALSRRPLTAGALAGAIAAANPGLGPRMMRITADREGWLDEVWLCLDTRLRYRTCPAHQGGLSPAARVRVWRDEG